MNAVLFSALAYAVTNARAETYALPLASYVRRLQVVRHYEFPVQQGKPAVAVVSGLMSFWGETNWQVVTSSKFKCSEPPDKTEVTDENNLGGAHRCYRVTWNAPKAGKITMDQTLAVELTCFGRLYTSAKLPYSAETLKRFSAFLGKEEPEKINPDNKDLAPLCAQLSKRQRNAEAAVESICDWVNENIKFKKGTGARGADEALTLREGSCGPMSRLACSMLRRIGIPAAVVGAKFIGSDQGHAFIEVYFPDAGWIFYDLSNGNRGFKNPDCLLTLGWGYIAGPAEHTKAFDGAFCVEKDAAPFAEPDKFWQVLRPSPVGARVIGVTLMKGKAPRSVKPRQRPIRELILDAAVPLGKRDYTDGAITPASQKEGSDSTR